MTLLRWWQVVLFGSSAVVKLNDPRPALTAAVEALGVYPAACIVVVTACAAELGVASFSGLRPDRARHAVIAGTLLMCAYVMWLLMLRSWRTGATPCGCGALAATVDAMIVFDSLHILCAAVVLWVTRADRGRPDRLTSGPTGSA